MVSSDRSRAGSRIPFTQMVGEMSHAQVQVGDPVYVPFRGETKLLHRGVVMEIDRGSRTFIDDLDRSHRMADEERTWHAMWTPFPGSPAAEALERSRQLRKAGVARKPREFSHGGGI